MGLFAVSIGAVVVAGGIYSALATVVARLAGVYTDRHPWALWPVLAGAGVLMVALLMGWLT